MPSEPVTAVIGQGQTSKNASISEVILAPRALSARISGLSGCRPGVRKTTRYRVITVRYEDENFKKHVETFSGFTAEIVQHEMDHLQGILI